MAKYYTEKKNPVRRECTKTLIELLVRAERVDEMEKRKVQEAKKKHGEGVTIMFEMMVMVGGGVQNRCLDEVKFFKCK